jgi:Flp pilus assembly protein TadG
MGRSHARARSERGAAAVEFGLVAPIVLTLLLGTIQYGLYFNDALNTRQGVREGARQGVVKIFSACGTAKTWDNLKCEVESEIGSVTGPVSVKVSAPDGWAKGNRLLVCAMVESDGGVGLLPMPNSGVITSKTEMSIELGTPPTGTAAADTPPAGEDWSWC